MNATHCPHPPGYKAGFKRPNSLQWMILPLALVLVLVFPMHAHAHLTWIEQGKTTLGLATGHHYPNKELSVSGDYVEQLRCTSRANTATAAPEMVTALAFQNDSLRFKLPFAAADVANCEAKLKPSRIELNQDDAYRHLRESRAPQAVVAAFEAQGRWQEQFFKSAQLAPIALGSPLYQSERAQFITKNDNKFNFNVIKNSTSKNKVYLYKNGQPVARQAVGLDSPSLASTVWLQTQADGEVVLPFVLQEQAMLHAVLIENQGDGFASQFLTTLIQ